jgi:hypothetical protein
MVVRQARARVATRPGAAALLATLLCVVAPAGAAGPVGVVTELHVAGGQVDVRPAGSGDWQPVKPLLSVHEGDQLRASGASRAVVVFASTQRPAVVTAANSPYTAMAPPQPGLVERVTAAVGFLQTMPREASRRALTVRGGPRELAPIVLLAPRESVVAPDAVGFEWAGPDTTPYTVRVVSGDGRVLWEKANLAASAIVLPRDEARLGPGRYRWEVETKEHGIQQAAFNVATTEAAAQARAGAAAVEQAGYPAATTAVLKAAALMRERFYVDARRELLRAIATSPTEPTLHQLLAELYAVTGPDSLAAAEHATAEALAAGR